MKRWITGQEIIVRWQGPDWELADAVEMGLEPISVEYGIRLNYANCLICEDDSCFGRPFCFGHEDDMTINARNDDCNFRPIDFSIMADRFKNCMFRYSEVVEYEKKMSIIPPEEFSANNDIIIVSALNTEERQELGRLRLEKEKWDMSIKASMVVGQSLTPGKRFTKKEVWKILADSGIRGSDLPDAVFNQIWANIPTEFRNIGGRPKTGNAADF